MATISIITQVFMYFFGKKYKSCFYLISAMTLLYITLNTAKMPQLIITNSSSSSSAGNQSSDNSLACRIPKLEPLDSQIREALSEDSYISRLGNISCLEIYPLLFNSSIEHYPPRLISLKTKEEFRNMSISGCCYRLIHRGSLIPEKFHLYPDYTYTLSEICHPINLDHYTEVKPSHDFIAIQCHHSKTILLDESFKITQVDEKESTTTTIVDMHAFVHNPQLSEMDLPNKTRERNSTENERLNVLVIGLDAMSRMNFIRTFPKSYEYLTNTLSVVEMEMYNKIGDNSLPNLGPLLTNKQVLEEKKLDCEANGFFDNCSFIWEKFAQQGYHTLFAEDDRRLGTFNYLKRGFLKPPTEYYFRAFNTAADRNIASQKLMFSKICYGPRFAFHVLLEYVQKMSFVMSAVKENYFQFTWSSSLTHDFLNAGILADKHLYAFLKWFHDNGYLANTMLIILGDHGARWGPIRKYYQGQLEERLPAMYFVLPEWFREKYSRAYRNLQINRNRLVTVWDLHQTFLDVTNLKESISEEKLLKREEDLSLKTPPLDAPGISMFLPISPKRTCKMAGIPDSYCTCNHHMVSVETTDAEVISGAEHVVRRINKVLLFTHFSAACAKLSIAKILSAGKVSFGKSQKWLGYQLNFETAPGGGHFEALVVHDELGFSEHKWKISGRILRTNLYGNQSWCVHDTMTKLYCYCEQNQKKLPI